jgi:hypothetical protein
MKIESFLSFRLVDIFLLHKIDSTTSRRIGIIDMISKQTTSRGASPGDYRYFGDLQNVSTVSALTEITAPSGQAVVSFCFVGSPACTLSQARPHRVDQNRHFPPLELSFPSPARCNPLPPYTFCKNR